MQSTTSAISRDTVALVVSELEKIILTEGCVLLRHNVNVIRQAIAILKEMASVR